MCTQVIVGDTDPRMPRWDRSNVTIVVSRTLDAATALLQVRTLLAILGAPQTGLWTTCWCGEPVEVPQLAIRTPRQYTPTHREEARRGA
jgi:hypothetical protein